MEKNEKDTFLTDTLLKQTSRIGSTRFTMRPSDIKKKVEDILEIEDENFNKKNVFINKFREKRYMIKFILNHRMTIIMINSLSNQELILLKNYSLMKKHHRKFLN